VTVHVSERRQVYTRGRLAFLLRAACADDAPAIVAAINAVCAEGMYMVTECYVPTPPWEAVLHAPHECPDHLLLVPQVGGKVVGWCRVFPEHFGGKSRHVADVGIGLLEPFRDAGIGTALLLRVIEWAQGQPLAKLTLSTFATNRRAIHVFAKVGFQASGVRHGQYRVNGQYVDEVLMERPV
jgi:RimJ/RimL family protein N-acetyltransferase